MGKQGIGIVMTMGRESCKSRQIAWIFFFEAIDQGFEGKKPSMNGDKSWKNKDNRLVFAQV